MRDVLQKVTFLEKPLLKSRVILTSFFERDRAHIPKERMSAADFLADFLEAFS